MGLFQKIGACVLDAVFPSGTACYVCNREALVDEAGLCGNCAERVKRYMPIVEFCPNGLDGFAAGIEYTDIVKPSVHRFKYNGAAYLAEFFAQYMSVPAEWEADVLIPVPLHSRRLRWRGYNQSALLSYAVSDRLNIPVDETVLIREKHTKVQARLNAQERATNVSDAFTVIGDCANINIVIVDDICTTGSTLSSCAEALRKRGAKAVFAVTACCASLQL